MAKKESNSRPARWARAIAAAQHALEHIEAGKADLETAFSELAELKSEYEEWRDNLPESLQQSALGEKLDALCDLDLDWDDSLVDVSGAEDTIGNAEGVDLPLGFGRD